MDSRQLAVQLRLAVLDMAYNAKASHIGGNYSLADIIAVLYSDIVDIDPKNPSDKGRDRVILSKGHCCAVLYAMLAERGFIEPSELDSFGANGARLSCHASHKVPGVELSTGSLGHGAAVAVGMALYGKQHACAHNVYAILGDGECDEGSIWEAAMFAGHNRLDNLTFIIDANGMQAMGDCKDIIDLAPLSEKWRAFGWTAVDVDGHDHGDLRSAFGASHLGRPKAIVAHTVKGKGVAFMENDLWWHYQIPYGAYYEDARQELQAELRRLQED